MRLYYNPHCSKSRTARRLLEEAGHAVEVIDYLASPPDADTLAGLIDRLDTEPAALVRTNDPAFADHGRPSATLNRQGVIALLRQAPALMQRPVLDTGTHALIARPPERVFERVDPAQDRHS